jgi:hypothetical protein
MSIQRGAAHVAHERGLAQTSKPVTSVVFDGSMYPIAGQTVLVGKKLVIITGRVLPADAKQATVEAHHQLIVSDIQKKLDAVIENTIAETSKRSCKIEHLGRTKPNREATNFHQSVRKPRRIVFKRKRRDWKDGDRAAVRMYPLIGR